MTLAEWAAIFTIAVAVTSLIKPVRGWIVRLWRKIFGPSAKQLLVQHIQKDGAQLDRIEAELHPNGGTSMRDAINEIMTRINENDAFLRASLNIHNVALFRTDVEGHVISVNRQYNRLTGYTIDEVEGDGWVNALKPSERPRIIAEWARCVDVEREFHDDVIFIKADTQEEIEFHVNVYKEEDSMGKVRGYLGMLLPS